VKRFHVPLVAALCLLAASCTHTHPRKEFRKLIERPRVPLAAQIQEMPGTNGLAQFHFSFATENSQRVPGVLIKPVNSHQRRPVVIALHGTGSSKANMLSLCRKLATNGFIAVAIDGRYHGERARAGTGSTEYNTAIARAWREPNEHPFYYDTVWDVMRLVDYLKTRDDVDAKRIGLMGFSKGGIETYLAAAVDRRIAAAAPFIGVQSFRWGLENNAWQARVKTIQSAVDAAAKDAGIKELEPGFVKRFYDRVVPGIYGEFDGPAMLPLIAPRPLLVINSDSDPNTPLPGVREAATAAQQAYGKCKADRFILLVQENTAHRVLPDSERAAIDWFVKWLKPHCD
jgi:dienelactone hydrolase